MTYETVRLEIRGAIAYVWINRPAKYNSLNRELLQELLDCFLHLQENHNVQVVILTGTGDKAFAAGADISELASAREGDGEQISRYGQQALAKIETLGKPVIAAVNGFALGGGCELAMACTLRIAADSAQFGQPEVKLGLIPGYGGTQRLPRLVGKSQAMELILTGRTITAQEAYRLGLVNQVVPRDELMKAAETLAQSIAANGPLAVKFAMKAINQGMELSLEQGLTLESRLFGSCFKTEDRQEGTRAFLEKRAPKFKER